MPRLMEKKDCLQTMAEVGSAGSVSQQMTAGKSLVRIDSKKGVWRIPTEEEDRAMDEEIAASFGLNEVLM